MKPFLRHYMHLATRSRKDHDRASLRRLHMLWTRLQLLPAMPVEVEVDTVLFDMDGTLIDSTPAVNATWVEFAKQYQLDIDHVVRGLVAHSDSYTTHMATAR